MKKSKGPVNRRNFLKGAAVGAAAFVAKPAAAAAQEQRPAPAPSRTVEVDTAETGKHASDFMIDVFKSLGMEYLFAMCAFSVRSRTFIKARSLIHAGSVANRISYVWLQPRSTKRPCYGIDLKLFVPYA